jgi:polysaccharide pyruvyl transferase CsaB
VDANLTWPVTIGVAGSYGGLNMGDEAILTVIVRELRRRIPGVRLVVFSRDAPHTMEHHDVDAVVDARSSSRHELTEALSGLSLLLLGGGGLLYDTEASSYLHVVRTAQRLGVPTATYAIGAGPLEHAAERTAVAEVLNVMDLITVREPTARRLLEEIGVENDVVVTADPALLLEPAPLPFATLQRERLEVGLRLVALSVRESGGAAAETADREFHALLATAADFIVQRYDAQAVFVPMERQDIREAHGVISHMARPESATVLTGTYTPGELRAVMGSFHMAVGMRLHFLMFAASAGVPIAPLPYASKVGAFLKAIGLDEPDLVAATNAGTLLAGIDRLWDLRDEQIGRVAERLPALRDAAASTATMTAELVGARAPA